MRNSHNNTFKLGDYWRECDECSWDYYRSELTYRWDGLLVCEACWDEEPRENKPLKTPRANKFVKD